MKTTPTRLITIIALFCAMFGAPFRMFATGTGCTNNTVQNPLDSGPGSLRFALENATNGETITFCPNLIGSILLMSGELLVTNSVTILGPGANVLTVDGSLNMDRRVFHITPSNVVTIAGLTIANGLAPAPPASTPTIAGQAIVNGIPNVAPGGGGIYNDHSSLTVSNCTLRGNRSPGGPGGAIVNDAGASGTSTVAVVNCTLNNNQADLYGGAILNNGSGGHAVLTLINSTVSGNTAGTSGGAIENIGGLASGIVTILNCTFNTNSAGTLPGAIHNAGGSAQVTIGSTILNASGLSPFPLFLSLGYNLSSDNGGGFLTKPTDQINTDPLLGPLQLNGGPTPTHAPLCGSPAIDKGTNFAGSATDQRGAPRTFDIPGIANAAGGDGTDIGAVESPISTFTVLNTNDSGAGSLRQAILDANASPGTDLIEFNTNAYGTITLANGELLITDCLILDGPGATNLAVNGNHASSVFHVAPSNTVTISSLTITNGLAFSGGGILNDHSTLTVNSCTVAGNSSDSRGAGGGLANTAEGFGSSIATVVNCTFNNNTASNLAGGILNDGTGGHAVLTVMNSTLSGNSASSSGGAIANFGLLASGVVTVLASTLSSNSAGLQGGGIYNSGTGTNEYSATLHIGSTILNASSLWNLGGTVTSLGYNLSSDGGGGFLNQPTDQTNTNPMLGPLQLNGGQTPTHALLCGSPAIDKGTNFTSAATDQRGDGFSRTVDQGVTKPPGGDGTDIGAFELQTLCNHPPVAICTNATVSAGSNCTATASINFGSYDPDAGDTIMLSQSPAGPYHLGTNIVTLTVTDNHGASNSCPGVVIVVDKTPPTIYCPTNIVTTNDTGQCSAVVSYTVTATDNCGSVTNITEDFPSGSIFSVGTNTVHVTAVDNAGNTNTCTFTITVLDKEPPLAGCEPAPNPAGKVFEPGKTSGTATNNPNGYYRLLAKDNCNPNTSPSISVKDTLSTFVAGPFKDGDIVRLKHAGGAPSSVPGTSNIVAVISLKGNGLAVATDASGNTTPDAKGCLMVVPSGQK